MADNQNSNQNKSEKDYDSMSREEIFNNFYKLTGKTPMEVSKNIEENLKNKDVISITNALFGDSKKGVKIKKVGQFGKLFKKKDENNEPIFKENEVAIEKVNEAKACFFAYIKKIVKENKKLFPNFTIDEQNTKKSSNRSFSSWIKNAFKYKNKKITGSKKQIKKDFFNNFLKNKTLIAKQAQNEDRMKSELENLKRQKFWNSVQKLNDMVNNYSLSDDEWINNEMDKMQKEIKRENEAKIRSEKSQEKPGQKNNIVDQQKLLTGLTEAIGLTGNINTPRGSQEIGRQ